jgi:phage repressor protein C with HTH and peptisase S24 domain
MSRLTRTIEKRMRLKGLTQKGLALTAGLNETAVRDILKGRSKDPQLSTLRALARVLDCSVEALYSNTNEAPKPAYGVSDRPETPWVAPKTGMRMRDSTNDASTLYVEEVDIASNPGLRALKDGRSKRVDGVWHMPEDAVGSHFSVDKGVLKVVRVQGDSMSPDFQPDDRVMINLEDTKLSPAGVFLLWDGAGFTLRRCELKPNTKPAQVILRARNADYGSYEVAVKDLTVCGRVIGKWQKV